MKARNAMMVFAVITFAFQLGMGQTADVEKMRSTCGIRAAKALGVTADAVEVKYEGQRVDKTYAVNGSAQARGQSRTFQCSFDAAGRRITRFVLNPAPRAARGGSSAGSGKEGEATERAGRGEFDANGKIPCARFKGQPMGQCDFGVSRAGGGSATVAITHPDGRKRMIFFKKGATVGADTSQADGNPQFRARKQSDLFIIQVGDERYEIPEAVITGG